MSHDTVALIVGIAIGVALVLVSQYMNTINNRISTLSDIRDGITQILSTKAVSTIEAPAPTPVEPDPVPPTMDPIPIDPANPPKNAVFYPKDPSRDPATYPICNCHGEPIKVGAEMVQWPLPNDQGVMLFHATWLKEQGMVPG